MNDLSGRIIRKSFRIECSESALRRFIGDKKGTGIYWKKRKWERRRKERGGKIQTVFEGGKVATYRYISRRTGIDLTWYYLLLNARVPHRFQFHDRPRVLPRDISRPQWRRVYNATPRYFSLSLSLLLIHWRIRCQFFLRDSRNISFSNFLFSLFIEI